MDQPVLDRRQGAGARFQPFVYRQHFGCGECAEGHGGHVGLGLFPAIEDREDIVAIRYHTRIHTSNTSSIT